MSHTPILETSPMSSTESTISADEPASPSVLKSLFSGALKIGVTCAILYYLYDKGMLDFNRVGVVLRKPAVFGTMFFLAVFNAFLGVVRWKRLLDGQGIHISSWECVRLTMIGVFFNTALPGAVSGDVVKGYYIVKSQPRGGLRIKSFTTLLLDRILGMSGLICVSFFAMVFNAKTLFAWPQLRPLVLFISLLWLGVVLFYPFILIDTKLARTIQKFLTKLPMGPIFTKFFAAVKAYETSRHHILFGLALSVVIHSTSVASIWILASALGGYESITAGQFLFLVPLGLLVTAIPIAPAGLGTGHYAFYFLLSLVGPKTGADLYTGFVSLQILMSLIGGIFYLRYRHGSISMSRSDHR